MRLPFFLRFFQKAGKKIECVKKDSRISCGTVSHGFLLVVFGLLFSGAAYAQNANLDVSQTFNPSNGPADGQFTSTFTILNHGPSVAVNAVLTSTLSAAPVGGTFNFDSYTGCTLSGVTLTCPLGNMNPGATATVTVVYTLGGTPGVWISEGVVASDTPDLDPANDRIERFVTTVESSDLELTASGPTTPVMAGGVFQYALSVKNNGASSVPSDGFVVVQFEVPANVRMTSASGAGWTCVPPNGVAGTQVTCTRSGPMAVNATFPLTINARAVGTVSGEVDATFSVRARNLDGSAVPDPDIFNNEAAVSIEISAGTDVSIRKTVSLNETTGVLTYTLTPRYEEGDPLTTVPITVTDTYAAAHFNFIGWVTDPSLDGWNCSTPTASGLNMTFACTRMGYTGASGTAMPVIQFTAAPGVGATDATNQAEIALGGGREDPVTDNNSHDVTINVDGLADITISKRASFTPAVAVVGQDFTYTLTARNLGPWSVPPGQPIIIEDVLPNQLAITGVPTGTDWTCAVSQSGVPVTVYPVTSTTANPVTVSCEYLQGLVASSTVTTPAITLPVRIMDDVTINNLACVSLAPRIPGTTPSNWRHDTIPGNNCSDDTRGTVVVATTESADLQIVKTASAPTVNAGEDLVYTLTVTNLGLDTATNVTLTDALSSLFATGGLQNVVITTLPAGGGACSVDTLTTPTFPLNGTSRTVTCEFPSLTFGETAVVEITVRPTIDATGNRANTATVFSADVGDPDHGNNSSTITSEVKAVYDLTVSTTASSGGVTSAYAPANSIVAFSTTVRNIGLSRAPTAQVIITLPANAAFVRWVGTVTNCTSPTAPMGGTMTCEWPAGIEANGSRVISYEVMAPATVGAIVTSSAVVGLIDTTAFDPESDLTNNTAAAQIEITAAQADIQVDVGDFPDPILLGDLTTYTIKVLNAGPSLANHVTMVSVFSTGTADFSYQGALTVTHGGSCVEPPIGTIAGQLKCTWPQLGIGEEATVTYEMKAEALINLALLSGSNLVEVSASADEEDPYPLSNSLTETTTANRSGLPGTGADLGITKTASKPRVTQGTTYDYTITVHNYGPEDVTTTQGAQVVDVLPVGISLTAVPAGCSYATATRTLTCLVGALVNGADYSVTVPVKVEIGGTGSIVNTAVVDMPGDLDSSNNTATATVQRYLEHIPTLSQGGMMALVVLLALAAATYRRRESFTSLRRNT
ncbi:MAG: DUF11 domain-containing protein [Burkholderiales bacterium]|jgi:uncharacterized repeat protein (TIGR01451 family)|nr:DUF11 domain-containing protein [Burkholderiales bacterium]